MTNDLFKTKKTVGSVKAGATFNKARYQQLYTLSNIYIYRNLYIIFTVARFTKLSEKPSLESRELCPGTQCTRIRLLRSIGMLPEICEMSTCDVSQYVVT